MTSFLWLSWDIGAGDGGLSRQAAGMAAQLAAEGDEVVVVTRAAQRRPRAVGDARCVVVAPSPPTMTWRAGGRLPQALAFATPALAAVVRHHGAGTGRHGADTGRHDADTGRHGQPGPWSRPDVVVADNWQAGLVARALASTWSGAWSATFVQVVPGLEVRRRDLGDVPDRDGEHVAAIEAATAAAADVVLARGPEPLGVAEALGLPPAGVGVLPFGVDLEAGDGDPGAERSGPGPGVEHPAAPTRDRGLAPAVVAVLPPRGVGDEWSDELADLLGAAVDLVDLRRAPWPGTGPDVVVVHDVERVDVAIAAAASGIPVVAGDLRELATALGHVVAAVVPATPAATAGAVADLPPGAAVARRRAVLADLRSSGNGWPAVATTFRGAVGRS